MSFDPSTPGLRASDADREAVVERLHRAATEGRLDADELEERISAAYAAKHCTELDPLVADITPPRAATPATVRPTFVTRRGRTNGLAVASLVASLLWMGWFGSVAAIVLGHVAAAPDQRVRRATGRPRPGRGGPRHRLPERADRRAGDPRARLGLAPGRGAGVRRHPSRRSPGGPGRGAVAASSSSRAGTCSRTAALVSGAPYAATSRSSRAGASAAGRQVRVRGSARGTRR